LEIGHYVVFTPNKNLTAITWNPESNLHKKQSIALKTDIDVEVSVYHRVPTSKERLPHHFKEFYSLWSAGARVPFDSRCYPDIDALSTKHGPADVGPMGGAFCPPSMIEVRP
jgi:hypothetical protein